jgi:hypothetical protein
MVGRGFSSFNVWPSPSGHDKIDKPNPRFKGHGRFSESDQKYALTKQGETNLRNDNEKDDDKEVQKETEAEKLAQAIVGALKPLLEMKLTQNSPEANSVHLELSKNSDLLALQKREKTLLLLVLIMSCIAIVSFFSALWSSSSVNKLLKVLYRLKNKQ